MVWSFCLGRNIKSRSASIINGEFAAVGAWLFAQNENFGAINFCQADTSGKLSSERFITSVRVARPTVNACGRTLINL
jgi:hypothetical protein